MLSSGAFARLCGVHKKTLFHYDAIGLLRPAMVAANGYRYYAWSQVDQLSKIKALQSVGFSLEAIEQQLQATGFSEGLATLRRQQAAIATKAQELLAVSHTLQRKVNILEHYEQIGAGHVFHQNYAETWLQVEHISPGSSASVNYLQDGYHFGILLYPATRGNAPTIATYRKALSLGTTNAIAPGGPYAGIYFHSGEEQIQAHAWRALDTLQNHGYPVHESAYVQDVASDFLSFPPGLMPFRLTVPIHPSLQEGEEIYG